MGSRLTLTSALGMALVVSQAQAQTPQPQAGPGPLPAAEAAKQGTELYNAGDYAGAVAPLTRAVEMEPNNFEYRFSLAQALRQSGNCGDAVPHYKQVVSTAPPDKVDEVKSAMAQCPNAGITEQPQTPAPPQPPADPVVVQGSALSTGNALLLVGSGAGLAAGLSLLFAAHSDDRDADVAASYEDHDRISTRADRLRIAAITSAGIGVALGVVAFYRIRVSKEGTQLSLSPRKGGAALVLERSW